MVSSLSAYSNKLLDFKKFIYLLRLLEIGIYSNYGTILHGIFKIGKCFLENYQGLIFLICFLVIFLDFTTKEQGLIKKKFFL